MVFEKEKICQLLYTLYKIPYLTEDTKRKRPEWRGREM
jgi:hypothetical protein